MSLKAKNLPTLVLFLGLNVTIYILFIVGFKDFWKEFILLFSEVNADKGIFVTIAPLVCFVLSGILSADFKAILVFWKRRYPLPGHQAFSEVGPNDARIDMKKLQAKIKTIPIDPAEQNKVWYGIYKRVQNNPTVEWAHGQFLLFRDLASMAFLFLITTPWFILYLTNDLRLTATYALICFLEYIVFCLVTQNTGRRFVGNVLAEYCCIDDLKANNLSA